MHCWVPKNRIESKPNLLLLQGFGTSAMWQWSEVIRYVCPHFNVYVPDLIFFGDSFTTRPERSDSFQAQCVMRVMEANSVRKVSVVGMSYGGFVAYSMAAQFKEVVERVVICCAGICLEEKDLKEGMFKVSNIEEAASILVPQTPEKLKQLLGLVVFKPPKGLPNCLLEDFIDEMYTDYVQERKDLVRAIPNRKLSDLAKIPQPTLIMWGEHDLVFPLELAHRLKRHLGENAELVVIKNTGHSFIIEKPKEFYKHIKSFLIDSLPPVINPK